MEEPRVEVQQEGKPPRFFPPNAAADQVLKGITGVEAGTLCQLGSGLEYAGNQHHHQQQQQQQQVSHAGACNGASGKPFEPVLLAVVCGAAVQPHATAWLLVTSTACNTVAQRASCHACLLVINISEACKVHKHVKACAAALFIFLLQHNALPSAFCTTQLHKLLLLGSLVSTQQQWQCIGNTSTRPVSKQQRANFTSTCFAFKQQHANSTSTLSDTSNSMSTSNTPKPCLTTQQETY
ncbi:hypothetical protein COO60DRAFT_805178 [Scenedesmus sp. NREL 46B-D3]|nr:hypothetical protein COO60DRAFT_805178 [Scenedesmus sp. NREL 46B-D3]